MNKFRFQSLLRSALIVLAAPALFADELAPAAADAPAAKMSGAQQESVRPGPQNRNMTPEMKAYVERLESIRKDRDERARAAVQAEKDMEARKGAIAEEDEAVGALVKTVAELRASLEAAEKKLAEIYAADETLVGLEKKKQDAEKGRDDKQRELNATVAAAMQERAARFRSAPQGQGFAAPALPAAETPSAEAK